MPGAIEEIRRRKVVASIICNVLQARGIFLPDFHNEIQVREGIVVENTSQKAGLSRAIFDSMFPKEPAPSTLSLYTDTGAFQGIVAAGELRLHPIKKRLGPGGELEAFAKAHGLQGYLDAPKGQALYETFSKDLFYISLTRHPTKNPSDLWGAFAQSTGVRLEFRIDPKQSDLRPIRYEQKGVSTLLLEINKALLNAGEPPFVPWTISRIGAFYLDETVSGEAEIRLLVKRPDGATTPVLQGSVHEYWPIPIGAPNPYALIDLVGIEVSPWGDRAAVEALVHDTPYSKVPITDA